MSYLRLPVLFLSIFLISLQATAAKDEFPGRKLFPHVKYIEIKALHQLGDQVVIVDARSPYEYQVLRIKGALNIPLSKTDFGQRILALRSKTDKPIVFYCNGHTCFKSYKATNRALHAGVKNVMAFDAGIFDWTKAYPKRAVLLGQSPVDQSKLISKNRLRAHMLTPKEFMAKFGPKSIILDARSRLQRAGVGLFTMDGGKHASLDDRAKIRKYVQLAKRQGKTLLIYDAVGKQVRWFQYYLEREKVKKYYFMKGGSRGYFRMLALRDYGDAGALDVFK